MQALPRPLPTLTSTPAKRAPLGQAAVPAAFTGTPGQEADKLTPFRSILFEQIEDRPSVDEGTVPAFFSDLNLDQVVRSITEGRSEYRLQPFFYRPLHGEESIRYRHEVLQDLQRDSVRLSVRTFTEGMHGMRAQLAQADRLRYKCQRQRYFLDAAATYAEAVRRLADGLAGPEIRSRGFTGLRDYLAAYIVSGPFRALLADIRAVTDDLATVRYSLSIKGDRVTVTRNTSETDYSAEVEAAFDKFKVGAAKDYRVTSPDRLEMNHIEAIVLDFVAKLYPDVFVKLDEFCQRHAGYLDATVAEFEREVQFYLACLDYVARFEPAGLRFCYPNVSAASKQVHAWDTFDLALADKLLREGSPVVCNDFSLTDPGRILVVSGPNQGGKTTFARTFGQLHYLGSIGFLVPGSEASLHLYDQLFTHFEKQEDATNLRGKLEDELIRIHEILDAATSDSILILNEIFTSTTLVDALYLGERILDRVIQLDALCVCVTFVDEWATLGPTTVSMVSTVAPDDPAVRTYKVVRRPADGLSYAATIAEKYGLSYQRLTERISL